MDFPSASLHSVLPMKYKNGIGIQVRIFQEIYMCLVFAPVFKFFYFLIFSSFTTHSQCPVHGNKSTGHASLALYPFFSNTLRSLARVSGPQEM